MKWKILIGCGVVVAALIVVLASGFGHDPHAVPFMLAGKPAPTFSLKRLDNGQTVSLDQLKGRPLVINFWATWCGPCREEQEAINLGAEELKDKATFIGVVFEDTPERASRYVRQTGDPMVQLVDPKSEMAIDYGTSGVPETYFIDAKGIIRNKYIGPISEPILRQRVLALTQPQEAKR